MISAEQLERYRQDGFIIAHGLFSQEEARKYIEHFMAMRAAGRYPGDFEGVDPASSDPLKQYPRMIHMHRWDETSLKWMLDARLNEWMAALLGSEPYAVQTMLYFKPPGARGQALHQDQFYLRVEPGTCMAAWMALDRCDEENGCMRAVPGSHNLPVLCTQPADTRVSFTDITVPVPESLPAVPVLMDPGDVLFFNGSVIHGSYPNTSAGRFRRALIGHYIVGEAEKVAQYYHPVLRMDGTEIPLGTSQGGGPCGVWTHENGQPAVRLIEPAAAAAGPEHE
ncbi:MAG: phytanoyl-CoA dioxygenase family protein [Armatimonadetes bacterium]|nr:phytanoyl-CoA dioxygenase family protein [Armatimonadota bacterium]